MRTAADQAQPFCNGLHVLKQLPHLQMNIDHFFERSVSNAGSLNWPAA